MTTIIHLHNHTSKIHHNTSSTQSLNTTTVQYDNAQSFSDHLLYAMDQQASVFAAMSLVNQINRSNGRKVVSDYQVHQIKGLFKSNPDSSKRERRKQNSKATKRNYGFSEIKSVNRQRDFQRGYEKAYIKMLSI